MKRILMLCDINSPHIQKWVSSLVHDDFYIGVFSLSKPVSNWYKQLPNFELHDENAFEKESFYKNAFQKISFLKVIPSLKKTIRVFKPQIIHAHYASSYGLIGALTKFHPYIISAWGSDVYSFPSNFIYRKILQYNFRKADVILSTSIDMKNVIGHFTNKKVLLTPFGIDTGKFKPAEKNNGNKIIIGTIKRMEETYGISYLIKAFKLITEKYPEVDLELILVGDGAQTKDYKKLVDDLNISNKVIFTGLIPHEKIVEYHNMLDVFVSVSLQESFGVAVLEASSCEKPVVVSNVGGLPEVVKDGETGYIVPVKNVEATVAAIEKLVLDKNLRWSMGVNGRKFVMENYEWNLCVQNMINIYNSAIK